jgi:integrase/recombinase XerD
LAPAQYGDLANLTPELEWLANITNPKTRRAYRSTFRSSAPSPAWLGLARAHVIAWRKDLEVRGLSPASIRGKLSALSSLFDYLRERKTSRGRRQKAHGERQ